MFTQREEAKIARIITPFRRMAVLWVKLLKKNHYVWRIIAEIIAFVVEGGCMKMRPLRSGSSARFHCL
jgi:hypothetical protein